MSEMSEVFSIRLYVNFMGQDLLSILEFIYTGTETDLSESK